MQKESRLARYDYLIHQGGMKLPAVAWIALSIIISIGLTIGAILISILIFKQIDPVVIFLIFFILIDLLLGVPYFRGIQRIQKVEDALPDALKQMADTLRAGATYEYALHEIASSQYGPLTEEMNKVLRKLEEGENFENSLTSLSDNIHSRIINRVITIIIDSVKAGAALADILDEISSDVRESNRIEAERKSKTILQVIFMVAAGTVVAPFIFGLTSVIIGFLIRTAVNSGSVTAAEKVFALAAADTIIFSMRMYIFIEVTAASVMIGIMRDGKMSKSIIYVPVLLLLAYVVYFISQIVATVMLGGAL